MPLKLNVGVSKKVGLPDYGSLGASCHVEFELDGHLLQSDLSAFQQRARDAYAACCEAVQYELSHAQQGNETLAATNGNGKSNGLRNGHHSSNGNGGQTRSHGRKATSSQVRAIFAIADRQGIALGDLLRSRYGVGQSEDLTITEASQLIDEMKGAANGAGGRQ